MKEQIVIHPEYVDVVIADRHREAEQARLIRQVKQSNKAANAAKPRRRWFLRLRGPLEA
jgi:hypothetical protein